MTDTTHEKAPRLRRRLERLMRDRAFIRRLPAPFREVRLVVSPDAALSYLRPGAGAFDRTLLVLAHDFARVLTSSDLVFDVGANVGLFGFSIAASSKARVACVEPDPFLVGLLHRSVALNPGLDIRIHAVALTDRPGPVELHIAGRSRAANAFERAAPRAQRGGVRTAVTVPGRTLDDLADELGTPSLIKIDVEGAEALVLAGATRTLKQTRPLLILEVGRRLRPAVSALLHAVD